jgi:hypothetical protein
MDLNFKRRAKERAIAAEVVNEFYELLRPAMDAGTDAQTLIDENRAQMAHIFGTACERHRLADEAAVARVFGHIQPTLASLRRRFETLERQTRPPLDGAKVDFTN